ncbi:conserved hypothetical protein [Culex quinquefasciatus]|uniref:Apoptosis regulatory protein Siva n=1 Tax=Culex quinquefasciatus TaxID=7176 RepID=B0WRZ4_CULQU|nr:uncharacterized protein LOC6042351 [Culex quinquefasciatus]EDS33612.1 conserved hypothetical protein [Culex quinquefasciatus]|eukprot:XP_001851478.1 conserved hypothetical protein [Culex quinquefasciatus]
MCDILVMNLNGNRKRLRSDDGEGGHLVLQRKMFINQQRMDQQDERKMKQIQDKTINMLFMGAKNNRQRPAVCQRECLRHVRLLGAGEYDFDAHSCPSWMEKKPDRKCRICDRQSAVHAECTNCNLELCEYCGVSCQHCPEKICMNCVNIFNCQTSNVPCCERCKIFN